MSENLPLEHFKHTPSVVLAYHPWPQLLLAVQPPDLIRNPATHREHDVASSWQVAQFSIDALAIDPRMTASNIPSREATTFTHDGLQKGSWSKEDA
jgi:hypothetical protein